MKAHISIENGFILSVEFSVEKVASSDQIAPITIHSAMVDVADSESEKADLCPATNFEECNTDAKIVSLLWDNVGCWELTEPQKRVVEHYADSFAGVESCARKIADCQMEIKQTKNMHRVRMLQNEVRQTKGQLAIATNLFIENQVPFVLIDFR
jgi:hypothetical protein